MPASLTDSLHRRASAPKPPPGVDAADCTHGRRERQVEREYCANWDSLNAEFDRITGSYRFGRDGGSVFDGPVNRADVRPYWPGSRRA